MYILLVVQYLFFCILYLIYEYFQPFTYLVKEFKKMREFVFSFCQKYSVSKVGPKQLNTVLWNVIALTHFNNTWWLIATNVFLRSIGIINVTNTDLLKSRLVIVPNIILQKIYICLYICLIMKHLFNHLKNYQK